MDSASSTRFRLAFLTVTVFLDAVGIGLIRPVAPALIAQIVVVPIASVSVYYGVCTASYMAGMFLFAPIMGRISDSVGRRPVLLLALTMMTLQHVVAATTDSFAILAAAQFAAGAAGASAVTAAAYVADITPPKERSQNLGLVWGAFAAGMMIGPVIGGSIAEFSIRAPFWAAAALTAANVASGFFILPESLAVSVRRPLAFEWRMLNSLGIVWRLIRLHWSQGLIPSLMFASCAVGITDAVIVLFGQVHLHWSMAEVGLYVMLQALLSAAAQSVLTRVLARRFDDYALIVFGLTIAASSAILTGFASASWQMYALLLPVFLSRVTRPAFGGLLSRTVTGGRQGELQGGLTSLNVLVTLIGALLGSAAFGYFNARGYAGAPYHLAATLLVAALAAALFARARSRAEYEKPLATVTEP
jgi:DHA1 family tetracycline resistance protein-like MFS transporter